MAELSIHEQKLEEIALAIQEKEGSSAPIVADDFAARIRAITTTNLPDDVHMIHLEPNDSSLGAVSGGGIASDGMHVIVHAAPKDGVIFKNWTEAAEIVSTDTDYSFHVSNNRTLFANFNKLAFNWIEKDFNWKPYTVNSIYADGKFVLVSNSRAYYSFDGLIWSQVSLPFNGYPECICYGGGKFVTTCGNKTSYAAYSEDGINWESSSMPSAGGWEYIAYGNGIFVALSRSSYGSGLAYSYDGITWTKCEFPDSSSWYELSYGNGFFLMVGSKKTAKSEDGINWTVSSSIGANITQIAFGNGKFLTVSYNTLEYSYSTNGIDFTTAQLPALFTGAFAFIGYTGNVFFFSQGIESSMAYFSFDGLNWEKTDLPFSAEWATFAVGPESCVAFPRSNNKFAYSQI